MYNWHTIQRDGSELDQSRNAGLNAEERKACKIFSWINKETKHKVSVDLDNGEFTVNGTKLLPSRGDLEVLSGRPDIEYRLIYATRHFVGIGAGEDPKDTAGLYIVGWQTTEEKKNIKRLLYIKPDGAVVFAYEG